MESLLTTAARRHIRLLARSLAPLAGRIERRCRARLRELRYDAAHTQALLAISPVAVARARSLGCFLDDVECYGRRLAKLNVAIGDVNERLTEFGKIAGDLLEGAHAPAREQLHLIVAHTLQQVYYAARESEAQVFYGLARAEAEACGLEDLLGRMAGVLTRAFPARAGRVVLLDEAARGKLARELYSEKPISGWNEYASFWSFPAGPGALVQLAFDRPYPWLPRERSLMQAAAERCAAVIERARVNAELERLEAQARRAEEEERRRIGRELHDDTAQSLLLLRLQLEMLQREAPPLLYERLEQSRTITERAIEDLRRTIAALSPALLERLGLASALRQLGGRFRRAHRARVEIRVSRAWAQLPPPAREVVYRVAQESLRNISKHSRATRVNLCLRSADKTFRLSIRDNGAGFDAQSAPGKPLSFGLAGMRERAALLGGSLEVRSRPGKGAIVMLVLPRAAATGEA
jgi:signal transduction histidine kinase